MAIFKRVSCIISFLFFSFSSVTMGMLESWTSFYCLLGAFLALFFLGLFFYLPKIEKKVKIKQVSDLTRRYYLSLMPRDWPNIKTQIYLIYVKKKGIEIDPNSTFIPLKKEELALLLENDPNKLWVKELINRISQMSVLEAHSLWRETK